MKDLKITRPDGDLAQIVIIDNSPIAYALNNEVRRPVVQVDMKMGVGKGRGGR